MPRARKYPKRKLGRKFRKYKRKMNYNSVVHSFKRTVASKSFALLDTQVSFGGNINFSNSGMLTLSLPAVQSTHYFSFAKAFLINELPNFSEFTSLYDQYKIIGIVFRIIPVNNTSGTQSIANVQNGDLGGFLHWHIDHDDYASAPASDIGIDDMRQRPDYKIHNLFNSYNKNGFKRYIKPRVAIAAYNGAFSGYMNAGNKWIDCNSPQVEHYGIKGIFEIVNPSSEVRYVNMKCEATYYLRFRSVR